MDIRASHISPPTGSDGNGSWAGSANPAGRHTRHSGAWWWWRAESTRRRGARSSPQGPALFGHRPLRAWRCTDKHTHTHTRYLMPIWQQSLTRVTWWSWQLTELLRGSDVAAGVAYLMLSFRCTVTYISYTLPWGMAPAGMSRLTPGEHTNRQVHLRVVR